MGGFNRPALKPLPQYGEGWLTGNHREGEQWQKNAASFSPGSYVAVFGRGGGANLGLCVCLCLKIESLERWVSVNFCCSGLSHAGIFMFIKFSQYILLYLFPSVFSAVQLHSLLCFSGILIYFWSPIFLEITRWHSCHFKLPVQDVCLLLPGYCM